MRKASSNDWIIPSSLPSTSAATLSSLLADPTVGWLITYVPEQAVQLRRD